jgi:hypothetical protein
MDKNNLQKSAFQYERKGMKTRKKYMWRATEREENKEEKIGDK